MQMLGYEQKICSYFPSSLSTEFFILLQPIRYFTALCVYHSDKSLTNSVETQTGNKLVTTTLKIIDLFVTSQLDLVFQSGHEIEFRTFAIFLVKHFFFQLTLALLNVLFEGRITR